MHDIQRMRTYNIMEDHLTEEHNSAISMPIQMKKRRKPANVNELIFLVVRKNFLKYFEFLIGDQID